MNNANVPERVEILSEESPESAVARFLQLVRKKRYFLVFHVIPNGPTRRRPKSPLGNIVQIGYQLLDSKFRTIESDCVFIDTHPYQLSEMTMCQTGVTYARMGTDSVLFLEAFADISELISENDAVPMSFGVGSLRHFEAAMELSYASFQNWRLWKKDWIDIGLIVGSILEPELTIEQSLRRFGVKPAWPFQDASAAAENASALIRAIFGHWQNEHEQMMSKLSWPLPPVPPRNTWFRRNFERIIINR